MDEIIYVYMYQIVSADQSLPDIRYIYSRYLSDGMHHTEFECRHYVKNVLYRLTEILNVWSIQWLFEDRGPEEYEKSERAVYVVKLRRHQPNAQ